MTYRGRPQSHNDYSNLYKTKEIQFHNVNTPTTYVIHLDNFKFAKKVTKKEKNLRRILIWKFPRHMLGVLRNGKNSFFEYNGKQLLIYVIRTINLLKHSANKLLHIFSCTTSSTSITSSFKRRILQNATPQHPSRQNQKTYRYDKSKRFHVI